MYYDLVIKPLIILTVILGVLSILNYFIFNKSNKIVLLQVIIAIIWSINMIYQVGDGISK